MGLTRRGLLRAGALALAGVWLDPRPARARAREQGSPLLAVVFLRGGADGLHLAPPVGDAGYAGLRGGLALGETLPFADGFALHPELAGLAPLVERRELAVIPCAGSPSPSRSHFEAQDAIDAGEVGRARLETGWLARALGSGSAAEPFAALACGADLPFSLRGAGAFAIADPAQFGVAGASADALAELRRRYAAADDPAARAGRRALEAVAAYEAATGRRSAAAFRPGRPRGFRLVEAADVVIRLVDAGLPIRAVTLESSGWDTHLRQGTGRGAMARAIRDLGDGLGRLFDALGEQRALRAVVLTEFGRTVAPNGSGGTDHGHGSVMLVAGAGVRGGVRGDWPGLERRRLHEGRDLPVATDFRSVLGAVLRAHLGGAAPRETFPGFEGAALDLFA